MENRNDRNWLIPVLTGIIALLLGACLGGLAGGAAGFLIGRGNVAAVGIGADGRDIVPAPWPRGTAFPNVPIPVPSPFVRPQVPQVEGEVVIGEVVAGSPAEQAGLRVGDAILSVDGTTLTTDRTLTDVLAGYHPGDRITLRISRNNSLRNIVVTLGARSDNPQQPYLGIKYSATSGAPKATATPRP